MLIKLHGFYANSIFSEEAPSFQMQMGRYWFHHHDTGKWLGVPVGEIKYEELLLLKTLFDFFEPTMINPPFLQGWHDFLFSHGEIPIKAKGASYRSIQFQVAAEDWERENIESVFKGFFAGNLLILWINQNKGMILEEQNTEAPTEEDFYSLAATLESDFYLKTYFYMGIPCTVNTDFPDHFQMEKELFKNGMKLLPSERVFTFEKLFPSLVMSGMQEDMKSSLALRLQILKEDPELMTTLKVFLQNNSNVSLTAKKLYIHRNTLQYRLDRFTEKTGINLKDFNSATTVYLACLLHDQI
ncbi:helix-turn-helix domain-containing protein [Bacillus sp. FJAT-29790]|uniref:PucR family transcriptional regulator n=1 Tax=Bacillus sp. FJAT-29790 TaxID=1895002 RepID=UPI001C21DC49|nr:helix-turn-helix domain-containing protein [Bacillus sp. FJAT-29790]MBU8880040.1 helix-turn-helix domain-containing protein [Bacillus sp. FJAT-29790]